MRVGKIEYQKFILPVGILVGGYFVLKNLHLFGGATSDNNKSIDDSTTSGVNSSINNAKNSGGIQTISDSQAASLAAQIYQAGVSDPVDEYTIRNSIVQSNTLLDLLAIVKAFGTKLASGSAFSSCAMFGFNCMSYNLGSFVRETLGPEELATVNDYLSSQGINYYF